jgi:hypothetical protein
MSRPTHLLRLGIQRLPVMLAIGLALLPGTTSRSQAQGGPACPCTIWESSAVPAVISDSDTSSVELGVKFRSDVAGFITAIRFYKGPLNGGTHRGNLWTSSGALLASVTFANETASGWQEATLPTPVAIAASTTYVASYFAPVGRYSVTENGFVVGVDRPPLHALATSTSANGVYRYGSSSGFPNQTYRASNYWVDVVFTTEPPGPTPPDTTPPAVTAVSPANAATGVGGNANVTATFSEAMDAGSLSSSTFELRDQSGALVPAVVSYDASTNVATLNPTPTLQAGLTYTATLRGGTVEPRVKDAAGNPLASILVWFFKRSGTDSRPPAVTAVSPEDGSVGVATTTVVTATFDEAMQASTITSTTFELRDAASSPVPAAVSYSASTRVATLTPAAPLAPGAMYRATVLGGATDPRVKDLAGIALGASRTWSFTTAGTDTTPPTVTAVSPPAGAVGVDVATSVTATFSEPMNAATLDGSTVELRDGAGTPVAASITYASAPRVVTLTPAGPLAPGGSYTVTIRGGAADPRPRDLAGNALAAAVVWTFTTAAPVACTANPIVCENQKPGDPPGTWDITGAGDASIQGFATDISVNRGETIGFKIDTDASAYRLDIYRMGYYGGDGARRVATVRPTIPLPQDQPPCLTEPASGLIDCGNWALSVSWAVPADATSGIYFARAVREAGGSGASHIVFVVRDDAGQAPILFQTSDTTWQAYNDYGGRSLYVGGPGTSPARAFKVSYNRPFISRGSAPEDWVFSAEYPAVRWLEANGYHVSYWTGVDTDRRGAQLLQHDVYLSVGHDEYWSGAQRDHVEAARNAGVHLVFLSGNEIFWKTRWEDSVDGSGTPYRTLVCYKETHANAKIDPVAGTWTGTWADPRFSPPADGGRPQNALSGTLFAVNNPGAASAAITVPEAEGQMRFWRNTAAATLAPGASATLTSGTLGYEWDEDVSNGVRPPGLFRLSATTMNVPEKLQDFGSTYGPGTATHSATLYRHASGALVFGAGTVQWSWGLDGEHDGESAAPDVRMRQAMVNLLADMGVQPATLQPGLVAASESSDTTAPISSIVFPEPGAGVTAGQPVTVSGSASDGGGGRVAAVEVSVDGGATWGPASGRAAWAFSWTPSTSGPATLRSRAVDDSGNLESPGAGVTVSVTSGGGGSGPCPCSLWDASTVPSVASDPDTGAVEVGVRFHADADGVITAIRFYKGPQNTSAHIGNLWTATGQLLATVTFTNETASGWQQAALATPVAISAGVTYVASYHTSGGRYAVDENYFATSGVDRGPLHAPAQTVMANGVYRYGASGFPTETFRASNYWVDVVFNPTGGGPVDVTPPTVIAVSPGDGAAGVSVTASVTATFDEPMDASAITTATVELRHPSGAVVPASVSYTAASRMATLTPASALAAATTYVATVRGGAADPRVKDVAGNALIASLSWAFTTSPEPSPGSGGCPCTIWSAAATPAVASTADSGAVHLGVKFRSDLDGFITGLRFYKGPANTGTHVGHLWTSTGQLLASVTFTAETASGWQQATLATPVAIVANTTYVASYFAPAGGYAATGGSFAAAGVDNPPLHALGGPPNPNGVYVYSGTQTAFPTQTFNATNYWVDVVFDTTSTGGPDTISPTVVAVTPPPGATGVSAGVSVTARFSEPMDPTTIDGTTVQLRTAGSVVVPAAVTYSAASATATLVPADPLAASTAYTVTVRGGTTDPRVKDVAGLALASDFAWTFSTAAAGSPLPPGQGPGGPLLVVTSAANPFSTYHAEILGAEGLNLFAVADIESVTPALLGSHDVTILGEMSLTPAQVTMLTDWVTSGGNLIAMRPDKQLAPLLGLTDAGGTLSGAYVLVDTAAPPGAGIVGQTIQFKGTADRYTLSGATAVATLYATATQATSHPAVTVHGVGLLGGQAAAFTYDLARSVVYTRQGNPAWSGQERDGFTPVRSDDLFFGAAAGDSQPDWIDLTKAAIPQADEQQRLLVNLIVHMTADRKPLPRFWYLPRGLRAVVVMTGDDHGNGGTAGRFDLHEAASPPGCVVENWECVRSTSYVYPNPFFTEAAAAAYHARGFEIGLHVNTGCADWTPAALADFYEEQLEGFQAAYPALPAPTTNRTHCIVWSDWATQPLVQVTHGIALDTSYYYWPPGWVLDRPGFFTGSGLPMRFTQIDGTLIDVYQATSQMTDESGQSFPFTINTLLDRALGVEGYVGAFVANMHTDQVASAGADAIVASARARGVPVISARQLLEWLDGRNSSSLAGLVWDGHRLAFTVSVGLGANGLQVMIPATSAGQALTTITRDGVPVPFSVQTITGVSWATFPAAPGAHEAVYGPQ